MVSYPVVVALLAQIPSFMILFSTARTFSASSLDLASLFVDKAVSYGMIAETHYYNMIILLDIP